MDIFNDSNVIPNSYINKEPYICDSNLNIKYETYINYKGDIKVHGLWENQKDFIIDVIITHLESTNYIK